MKTIQIFILVLFVSQTIISQTDFRPGYIVTNDQDTISGLINYSGYKSLGKRCRFKDDKENVNVYLPNDIVAFGFGEKLLFVSREVDNEMVFLQYLIKGELDVFYLKDAKGDRYFLSKEGEGIDELVYKEEVMYLDGKYVSKTSKNYIGLLKYYMQDAPELNSRIDRFNKPKHDNLIKIAEDYHNVVCDDNECLVYVDKKQRLKIQFEPTIGLINYKGIFPLDKVNSIYGGFNTYIWMPDLNERFYFRTGLLFSNASVNGKDLLIRKLPMQFMYKAPKWKVRPIASYGVGIYNKLFDISTGFMLGLDIMIDSKSSFTVMYDADYTSSVPLFPQELMSQSLSIGFKFNLN